MAWHGTGALIAHGRVFRFERKNYVEKEESWGWGRKNDVTYVRIIQSGVRPIYVHTYFLKKKPFLERFVHTYRILLKQFFRILEGMQRVNETLPSF